uniref:Uncharacterized protein n=1 Tax=Anopheles melas TaxID=34690 RepID=A0A182U2T8_9DIPT
MAVCEAFCFPLRRAVPCRMVLVRCCCVLRMHTVVPVPVVVTYVVVVVSMQQDRNRSTHRNCWTIERWQMSRCDGSHWIIASGESTRVVGGLRSTEEQERSPHTAPTKT